MSVSWKSGAADQEKLLSTGTSGIASAWKELALIVRLCLDSRGSGFRFTGDVGRKPVPSIAVSSRSLNAAASQLSLHTASCSQQRRVLGEAAKNLEIASSNVPVEEAESIFFRLAQNGATCNIGSRCLWGLI